MRKLLEKLKLNNKGFTFAEVVVAIGLFAVIGTMGFTMFSISSNYMSKAKREETKRAQAYDLALKDTFTAEENNIEYNIIYPYNLLEISYSTDSKKYYFAKIPYSTDYGDVTYSVPLTLACSKSIKDAAGHIYQRFKATIGSTTRYIVFYYPEEGTEVTTQNVVTYNGDPKSIEYWKIKENRVKASIVNDDANWKK